MKNLLLFLLKCLLIAAVFGPLWAMYIGPKAYNPVFTGIYNFILPEDYVGLLAPAKNREGERTPAKDMLLIYKKSELDVDSLRKRTKGLELLTLHFNVIPFVALFLATPGISWKRRLISLPIAFVFLSLSHLLHAYLNYYAITHQKVDVMMNKPFQAWLKVSSMNLVLYLRAFMEQAGSRLISFLLWIVFYNKKIFETFRSVKPDSAGKAESAEA